MSRNEYEPAINKSKLVSQYGIKEELLQDQNLELWSGLLKISKGTQQTIYVIGWGKSKHCPVAFLPANIPTIDPSIQISLARVERFSPDSVIKYNDYLSMNIRIQDGVNDPVHLCINYGTDSATHHGNLERRTLNIRDMVDTTEIDGFEISAELLGVSVDDMYESYNEVASNIELELARQSNF